MRVAILAVLPDSKTARRRHHPAFRAARRPAGIPTAAGGSRAEKITRTRLHREACGGLHDVTRDITSRVRILVCGYLRGGLHAGAVQG